MSIIHGGWLPCEHGNLSFSPLFPLLYPQPYAKRRGASLAVCAGRVLVLSAPVTAYGAFNTWVHSALLHEGVKSLLAFITKQS